MKIGILTFHCAINYGAVLQAYGLQETLKSMGHEVYVIDYRPKYLIKPYRLFVSENFKGHGFKINVRYFFREFFAIPIRYKRRCAFNRFIEKYLHLVNLDLYSPNNDFDCFVFGSDQIWNPKITHMDSMFFGNAPCFKEKRMITYAASAGSVTGIKEININSLKGWLSNFSTISVREESLSHFLKEELHVANKLVLDPVLLAGKDVFLKIASYNENQKPYLLFFSLIWNDEALDYAKRYAAIHNLNIIEMYSMKVSVKNNNVLQDLSPEEFIGYFQNASFVVTSSFHGTVFSILFHKPFISVGNNEVSRFQTLLNLFGLEERFVDITDKQELNLTEINWKLVDEILFGKRQESVTSLVSALK